MLKPLLNWLWVKATNFLQFDLNISVFMAGIKLQRVVKIKHCRTVVMFQDKSIIRFTGIYFFMGTCGQGYFLVEQA